MGMAASQARFLGLTARKTNVEYEGQQINQQRTALGNETANYYNQMLGMSVPVPPAIDNYTKTIYTFSDGALNNSITSLIARNNGLYNVSYLKEWQDDFSVVAGTSHVVTRLGDVEAGFNLAELFASANPVGGTFEQIQGLNPAAGQTPNAQLAQGMTQLINHMLGNGTFTATNGAPVVVGNDKDDNDATLTALNNSSYLLGFQSVQKQIDEKNGQISEKQGTIGTNNSTISQLQSEINANNTTISSLQGQSSAKQTEIDEMYKQLFVNSWTNTGIAGEAISGASGLSGQRTDWNSRKPDANDPAYMNLVDSQSPLTPEGQTLYSNYVNTVRLCKAVAMGCGWYFSSSYSATTGGPGCYLHILGALLNGTDEQRAIGGNATYTTSAGDPQGTPGTASWFVTSPSVQALANKINEKDSAGRYIMKVSENPNEDLSSIGTEKGKILYSSYEMQLVNGVAQYKTDAFGDKILKSIHQAVIDFYAIAADFGATGAGSVNMFDANQVSQQGSLGIKWATLNKAHYSDWPDTYFNKNDAGQGGDWVTVPDVCSDTVADLTIMGFLNSFEDDVKNSYRTARFNDTQFNKDMEVWNQRDLALQNQYNTLYGQYTQAITDKTLIDNQISSLQTANSSKQTQITNLTNANSTLSSEISQLQSEVQLLETQRANDVAAYNQQKSLMNEQFWGAGATDGVYGDGLKFVEFAQAINGTQTQQRLVDLLAEIKALNYFAGDKTGTDFVTATPAQNQAFKKQLLSIINQIEDTFNKYMIGKDTLRLAAFQPTAEEIAQDDYLKTLPAAQIEKVVAQENMWIAQLNEKYGEDDWMVRYVQNTTTGEWVPQFLKRKDLREAVYGEEPAFRWDQSLSHLQYFTIGSEKKVEEVKNVDARLEQDSTGRLINITLNPGQADAVTYALTTNTIADQAKYDDAINQYEFTKYQYDQMINEINAKIQIIQTQDKNLELRLKQLDTEQNAIQTEMDAVSKVIQKNVESTFKTFG